MVKSFTLDPIIDGFKEYELQLNATQTILANTASKGEDINTVTAALDELNKYADDTIYNFTEMTTNIGRFTAAGVGLKDSVSAIKGMSNLAAVMEEITGHFAHNEQSLRMVEILERGGRGLNLTNEVRDGILNHTGKGVPTTFEGRIVRIADRIAYLCHDYDDSIRAGLLSPEELPAEVRESFGTDTSAMITSMVSDMIVTSEARGDAALSPAVQRVMDAFRAFMFERIYHSKTLAHERAQAGFVLRALMDHFTVYFDTLPREFIERAEKWGREQCVVDYVAGLTDSYAVALFREIYIPPVDQMTIKPI
ncbi:MAG: hypothetical protein ACFNLO_07575 [Selenomonas massiliensis]